MIEPRPRRAAALVALVLALTAGGCATPPTAGPPDAAVAVSGDGIGGTGIDPGADGIGGTGIDPGDGIGGTGIIGAITRLDPLTVNGLRLQLAAGGEIVLDGEPATGKALRVGQVVEALARQRGDTAMTRRITIHHAVVGEVSAVVGRLDELRVLGQRVRLDEGTVLAPGPEVVAPGQRIRVSGFRLGEGTIIATRIEPAEPHEWASVLGTVTRVGPRGFAIGELEIESTHSGTLAAGREAHVIGRLDAGRLIAARVELRPTSPFAGHADRLRLQGYAEFTAIPHRLRLGRVELDLGPRAQIEAGAQLGPLGLRRVQVEAVVHGDGRIRVERMRIDPAGAGAPPRTPPPSQPASPPASPGAGSEPAPPQGAPAPKVGAGGSSSIRPTLERPEVTRPAAPERPATPQFDRGMRPQRPTAVDVLRRPELPAAIEQVR